MTVWLVAIALFPLHSSVALAWGLFRGWWMP